jgi:hypothetical protein
MAYVYRHIRLDKNQPFYIGIGSDEKYNRAYNEKHRNKFWKAIASKSDYEVEIILDGLTWDQACAKEIEFIKLYGRRDKRKGCLVNLTDGGEGGNGAIRDSKFRKVVSEKMKGKRNALGHKHSEESKKIISEKLSNLYWEKLYDEEFENAKRLGFAR